MSTDPAEKWKAKAHETLTRASVRSGQKPATRLHYDTLYEIKVDEIAAALAEAYEEGREAERYKPGPKVEEYPGD